MPVVQNGEEGVWPRKNGDGPLGIEGPSLLFLCVHPNKNEGGSTINWVHWSKSSDGHRVLTGKAQL